MIQIFDGSKKRHGLIPRYTDDGNPEVNGDKPAQFTFDLPMGKLGCVHTKQRISDQGEIDEKHKHHIELIESREDSPVAL